MFGKIIQVALEQEIFFLYFQYNWPSGSGEDGDNVKSL